MFSDIQRATCFNLWCEKTPYLHSFNCLMEKKTENRKEEGVGGGKQAAKWQLNKFFL